MQNVLSSQTLSELTNEYEDIMEPHFTSSKFLLFKYYSPRYEGIRFRGSIFQNLHHSTGDSVNGGSCCLHYERGILQVKNKLKTDGQVNLALDFDLNKYSKNLSSQIKIKTNHMDKEYSGKLKFLWYKNRYSIKSTLDWGHHKCFSSKIMGLVFNEPNRQLGLGTGLAFAFEDKQFSIYNLTLWYVRNYAKFVLTHKSKRNKLGLGELSGRIYNKVDDKTDVALGFKHSFTGSQDKIALGLRYKHSDTFSIKTKIDSNLNMKAAFQLYFDKNLQLVITSNHNVAESIDLAHKHVHLDNTPPISLKISFGEF